MEVINRQCNTHVIVQNTFIFGCPIQASSSVNLGVEINQPVSVQSKYSAPSTLGIFYHCLGFQQNGGKGGNLSVVCRSQHTEETTTMETSTTTASSTTRLLNPTTGVSSMELIVTSATNKNNSDVTISTDSNLSSELKCDHRIAESLLSLQIPLAIFVVISTVSTILNIYLYIHNKSRNKSRKDKKKPNTIINHQSGNNAETYTELGNTVSGESENQYESISRQRT